MTNDKERSQYFQETIDFIWYNRYIQIHIKTAKNF
nr:MAG TPA: hypothetical protein [Caudoviricetes sp.]